MENHTTCSRIVSICMASLLWLAMGVGYACASDIEEKAETVVIPLDQIAGLGRGGLRTLEPELHIYRDTPEKMKKYSTPEGMEEIRRKMAQSLVIPIERAMSAIPIGKVVKPLAGFAVRGKDSAALPGVHRALVLREKPNESFSVDEEVSLVFFAHPASPYVRLDHVVRRGNTVEIHYMLISHGRLHVTSTLALIPCGKLPVGDYDVQMIRSASNEKEFNQQGFPPVETGMEDRIVCRSFRFRVSGQSSEDLNGEVNNNHSDLLKEDHDE